MSTYAPPQEQTAQAQHDPADVYGLMAEFDNQEDLMKACANARDAGYKTMDAYTPVPIHGLTDALGWDDNSVQRIVFCCALVGMSLGFGLMYMITMVWYPMNVGGRPNFSWPAFVPPTFETTILLSAFGAVFGMLAMNGLPSPYHPVFNNPRFIMASSDRFFLCIEAEDPKFDLANTRKFLEAQHPAEVVAVEN
ncbi:MAG: DUF3341 domain-containing protein [Acidobacteria bacterium]|nr:DUF3341 domain-containing protein [Acidobacteriota bacterium]